jgi:hypothetical protein
MEASRGKPSGALSVASTLQRRPQETCVDLEEPLYFSPSDLRLFWLRRATPARLLRRMITSIHLSRDTIVPLGTGNKLWNVGTSSSIKKPANYDDKTGRGFCANGLHI